ncbi:hypothetical protein NC652_035756 [Populus alba x Populus x berolinensis]|nr:hypothetical protein NC652_035756 [Populus alba x Populus x berolinensis]
MRWGPHVLERERDGGGYRTGIKLSGLDNAGKSVPFLHGLERFPASGQLFLGSDPSFPVPITPFLDSEFHIVLTEIVLLTIEFEGTQLSFESFFPFLLQKS